jgi:voltage-gated potassium channel
MTQTADASAVSTESRYDELSTSKRRLLVLGAALRAVATAIVLVALYYVLPLDRTTGAAVAINLIVGLAALGVVVAWQVRGILRARYPRVKMIEAVFVATPLYLVLFAPAYVLMAIASSANFGHPLTRTDALYFSTTVFSTVGFGDIAAKSQAARLMVTVQMIGDLVFIGLGLKVLLGAAQAGVQRRSAHAGEPPGASSQSGSFAVVSGRSASLTACEFRKRLRGTAESSGSWLNVACMGGAVVLNDTTQVHRQAGPRPTEVPQRLGPVPPLTFCSRRADTEPHGNRSSATAIRPG